MKAKIWKWSGVVACIIMMSPVPSYGFNIGGTFGRWFEEGKGHITGENERRKAQSDAEAAQRAAAAAQAAVDKINKELEENQKQLDADQKSFEEFRKSLITSAREFERQSQLFQVRQKPLQESIKQALAQLDEIRKIGKSLGPKAEQGREQLQKAMDASNFIPPQVRERLAEKLAAVAASKAKGSPQLVTAVDTVLQSLKNVETNLASAQKAFAEIGGTFSGGTLEGSLKTIETGLNKESELSQAIFQSVTTTGQNVGEMANRVSAAN